MYLCGEKNRYQHAGVTGTGNLVRVLAGANIVTLACGESHIIALNDKGEAYVAILNGALRAHGDNRWRSHACNPRVVETHPYTLTPRSTHTARC